MTLRYGTRLVAFILLFSFFIDHYLVICEVLTCKPAEIGSNHEVKFNVTSTCINGQPRVDSNEGVLATCPHYSLLTKNTGKYKITMLEQNSNYKILTLMIYNISMPPAESSLYYNIDNFGIGKTENCNILLYHKANDLKCSSSVTKVGLRVDCLSSEMYPGGPCIFDTNLKNGYFEKKDINVSNTSNSNSPYVTKMCTLSVPAANLTYRRVAVNVTVYPKVTDHKDDQYTYGTKKTMVINLERPSVRIENCPSTVNEGGNVTCHCQRSDRSDVDVIISWYYSFTHINVSNDSISFIGNRNIKALFYCQSVNIFGWKSDPVFYQPYIASGPDGTHIGIAIPVSIAEAVLLVISWIIVAFLCVKLRRYRDSNETMSAKENAELKEIEGNDDGYLTPIDLTNVNIGQQIRGDYDSLEPYHCYEAINRVEP